jgi:HEAT repeat protein
LAAAGAEDLRAASLSAASLIGPEAGDVPALIKLVNGANADSRRKACAMIGKMGEQGQPAAQDLALQLKNSDQAVRLDVVRTLVALGPGAKNAAKALTEALKDKDQDVAIQAARALIKIGDAKAAATFLGGNLKQGSLEQRKECVLGLAEVGPDAKAAAKDLLPLFDEDVLRPLAQDAVIKIGKAAVPSVVARLNVMIKNAQGSNAKARLACVVCLREINQPLNDVGVVLGLVKNHDPVPENREAANEAGNRIFNNSNGAAVKGPAPGGN